jgi:CheY-like chemotaxis protein
MINRKLEFIQDCDDFAHPYLYGDELHLRNVFINILGNAVKFTPDGGRITFRAKELSCENNRATYRFECEDTGIGISEEFQKKIFEEFSQDVDSGRTTYKGTGLGMAISKQYVDLMGGQISVKSKVGEGSLFIVELTFDVSEEVEEKPVFDIPGNLEGMKVLLVEDNELNMEIAKDILSDEDIQITEAENGKIAVDKFTASEPGSFDAILMDIMMPEMNGYDATRAIRASDHPEAKTIPIIAMTANTYREDVEKSMAAGMNAHIGKPIDIDVLLSTLGQYWKNAG